MLQSVKEFFIRREISRLIAEKGCITGAVVWLNAAPGRKRGVAAIFLGVGAAMHHMGWDDWAKHAESGAQLLQYVEPGVDFVGLIMAILGFGHTVIRPTAGTSE